MEQTLFSRDVIWVNKLKYGPRLPRSPYEIPWVNIMLYLNGNSREITKKDDWKYKRLSGTTKIKNGDVLVFDMFDENMIIVKRCMGIAGDTLKIIDGNVTINRKLFNPSKNISNTYKLSVNNGNDFYRILDSLDIDNRFKRINKNGFEGTLSHYEINLLESKKLLDATKIITDTLPTRFPESELLHWTLDNYGPYIIPKKGMTIKLNQVNFDLYNKAINDHEDATIETLDGYFYLNGKQIKSYRFKHDYYFMMGDNRKGSQDSRYWGLVPENRIIGKVPYVLFSNYKDEFQWDRFFKAVN